ncbi:MAG: flagellar motor protein MotB [Abditibacteriales bacterium]|nr:flagellar motor protein MotB [Abditibacteriales bacterium]
MTLRLRKKSNDGGGGGGGGGHDGGGALRWLLTYADMITLLMAFFIMLYSMSVMNMAKFRQLAISVRSGFGGEVEGKGVSIVSPGAAVDLKPGIGPQMPLKPLQRVERRVRQYVSKKGLSHVVSVHQEPRGLVVSFRSDHLLFDRGSAELKPSAKEILRRVMEKIRPLNYPMRVEGHTCNLPIRTAQFPSNWELSTARATNVVRFLLAEGLYPAERLSAAGYADVHPVAPNDEEANRIRNRRVDLVIIGEKSAQEEPRAPVGEDIKSQILRGFDLEAELLSSQGREKESAH